MNKFRAVITAVGFIIVTGFISSVLFYIYQAFEDINSKGEDKIENLIEVSSRSVDK